MAGMARGGAENARGGTGSLPGVRAIAFRDLGRALAAGWRDFRAAPLLGLFFGAIYAGGGWLILLFLWYLKLPHLAYPTAMGFVLVAPFVVVGLYDVSRKLERGEALTFGGVLGSVWEVRKRDLRWMALVTSFAFVIWLDIAAALFFGFMGFRSLDADLLTEILTTGYGRIFLVTGHLAGAVIAFSIFAISVVSFPMLFDRDIDFVTAMTTSVRTVVASPLQMLAWCVLIGVLSAASIVSAFVLLLVVLPVLGHASWHLYRLAVEPERKAQSLAPVSG